MTAPAQRQTARKTTARKRRPPAKTPRLPKELEAKPLPVTAGSSYIDFGCRRVWLDPEGTWLSDGQGNTVRLATICVGDDNESMEEEHSERFDRFMLSMYELARRAGIEVPPVPEVNP